MTQTTGRAGAVDDWLARPEIWRLMVVLAVAVHAAFVVAPFDVLYPHDPWALGRSIWQGQVPYRDFVFEYPPGAIVAFLLPGLFPHSLAPSVLALQAVACELGVLWLIREDPAACRRWVILATLAFPVLSGGFDALPLLALVWATAALAKGDPRGWWVAGAGAVVKLLPGLAWGWCRKRWTVGIGALIATVALLLSPLLVASSERTYLGYQADRGVEQGSVAASLTFLASSLRGRDTEVVYRFSANEIPGAGGAALVVAVVLGGLAVAVSIRSLTAKDGIDPWLATLALLLLVLCASKVLSPQFVAIAAPLFAVMGGVWFLVGLPLVALTVGAFAIEGRGDGFMAVVAVRNGLLVVAALVAALGVLRARSSDRG